MKTRIKVPKHSLAVEAPKHSMAGGTCVTCGKKIDYGTMYCKKCRPK